ncbi:PGF-CTERM sorting domain-containing protein [Streptomyces virginiae]|uniref:PGF-CTERM sorting domain-containing protein n=1 Tax=Streptomyces virginiae TaxID=1961 RepID=UPI0036BB9327
MTPPPDTARHPRAYVAPLVSTLLTLPMAAVAFFFVGLAPMACDSCGGEVSARFDASYGVAFPVFGFGLVVALVALLSAWALPWQRRNAAARVWPAVIAPAAVVLDFIVFHGLVDWP